MVGGLPWFSGRPSLIVSFSICMKSEIILLLRQPSHAIKNQLRARSGALGRNTPIGGNFLPFAGSLSHKAAMIDPFPAWKELVNLKE